jgi:hypothetical protein
LPTNADTFVEKLIQNIMKKSKTKLEPVLEILEELKLKIDSYIEPKKYYRNNDLKKYFGLSDNTICNYRDKNILPFSKIGEIYFYPIREINLLMNDNSNYMFVKDLKKQI